MKFVTSMLAAVFLFGVLPTFSQVQAHEDKQVTLSGTLMCAKCGLKQTKSCVNALQVKEGGKTVTYYLEDKRNKEAYHEDLCGGGTKAGSVTGNVVEKEGKKWIKVSKVELKP